MMAVIPFRFVHAAQLQLDEPLAGVGLDVSSEVRRLAEEATLIAWQRIVDRSLEADVDAVLLAGNVLDSRTGSLRARVALERGFEKLAAQGIQVLVAPGETDSPSTWQTDNPLPPNVHLLADEQARPVLLRRDGEVLASVRVLASPLTDEARWTAQGPVTMDQVAAPFHIGLVPAGTPVRWEQGQFHPWERPDVSQAPAKLIQSALQSGINYVALGLGKRGTQAFPGGTIHDPGLAQSLNRNVSGPCGVSFVEVSAQGEIRTAPNTVAPVRWESLGVELDPGDSWDDLVDKMGMALLEREPDEDDELWIVRWRIRGSGPVFDSLSEPKSQRDLWDLLEVAIAADHATRRVHQLQREPHWERLLAATEATVGRAFLELIEEQGLQLLPEVRRELLEANWPVATQRRLLSELLEQTPANHLVGQAKSTGLNWLT